MRLALSLIWVTSGLAYQPSKPDRPVPTRNNVVISHLASAALSFWIGTQPVLASVLVTSETAAQISLNKIPPSSISVQIKDLPVVGKLASGIYSKLPDSIDIKQPSVVIQSPPDKAKAIQNIVKSGHMEFDVSGIVNTHLDIDVAAEKAGVMNVRIASDLIPRLPYSNSASANFAGNQSPTGGKESPWNMVKNMGSGEVYYYNEKTGVTQYAKPVL